MNEVFYVVDGEVEFIIEDKVMTASKGDCIIVKTNINHSLICNSDSEIIYYNLLDK